MNDYSPRASNIILKSEKFEGGENTHTETQSNNAFMNHISSGNAYIKDEKYY